MPPNHTRLHPLEQQLDACSRGELPMAQLIASWRAQALPLPLPPRFAQVLADVLDRLEAGALFSEESCSFSQRDLLAQLRQWLELAEQKLDQNQPHPAG